MACKVELGGGGGDVNSHLLNRKRGRGVEVVGTEYEPGRSFFMYLLGHVHEMFDSLHTLFRYRNFPTLQNDRCCILPMWSTYHHVRLQILSHIQSHPQGCCQSDTVSQSNQSSVYAAVF